MPLKSKSVMTKAGDRHRVTISTMDNDVKAGPLDPKVTAMIRGDTIAQENAKKKGKTDNKNLAEAESSRKKANRKKQQQQKKKVREESKKFAAEQEKKKA